MANTEQALQRNYESSSRVSLEPAESCWSFVQLTRFSMVITDGQYRIGYMSTKEAVYLYETQNTSEL